MRKLNQYFSTIGILSTLTLSWAAVAQDAQWYEIEVMVVANKHSDALSHEYWPIDPGNPSFENTHSLKSEEDINATKNQVLAHTDEQLMVDNPFNTLLEEDARVELTLDDYAYTITPKWQWNFNDSEKKLQKHADYTVMLHTAWRQPISEDKTRIQLNAGEKYALTSEEQALLSQGYEFDPSSYQVTPTDTLNELTSLAPQQVLAKYPNFSGVTNPYALEGTITIHKGRYLHSDVDMVVQLPAHSSRIEQASSLNQLYPGHHTVTLINKPKWRSDAFTKLQSFRLTESRKMREKQFHYLDHPALGVFLRIVPIDTPDLGAVAQTTAPT